MLCSADPFPLQSAQYLSNITPVNNEYLFLLLALSSTQVNQNELDSSPSWASDVV